MAKVKTKKSPKRKASVTHPSYAVMVAAAITNLKQRKGSSVQAIKKYIAANYQVDLKRQLSFIKQALKNGVAQGKLIQVTGSGATGSFKLNTKAAEREAAEKKKEKERAKQAARQEKAAETKEQKEARKRAEAEMRARRSKYL